MQLEPFYRDSIVDFSKASTLERTVLMCMERIAELEGRADAAAEAAAEALRVQCERHRATLVKCIMCIGSYSTIFVDVMAWLIDMTPTTARAFMCNKKRLDLSDMTASISGVIFTDRARELSVIAKRGVDDDGKFPTMADLLPSNPADDEFDIAAMLSAMTTDELEDYWGWRLEYVGWGRVKT